MVTNKPAKAEWLVLLLESSLEFPCSSRSSLILRQKFIKKSTGPVQLWSKLNGYP